MKPYSFTGMQLLKEPFVFSIAAPYVKISLFFGACYKVILRIHYLRISHLQLRLTSLLPYLVSQALLLLFNLRD
jgi:hypothetical protein